MISLDFTVFTREKDRERRDSFNTVTLKANLCISRVKSYIGYMLLSQLQQCTYIKLVLETTCTKRPPALRDHCSDTTTLLNLLLHRYLF